ncbi:unnamed protein product [Arctogadus glacialis]
MRIDTAPPRCLDDGFPVIVLWAKFQWPPTEGAIVRQQRALAVRRRRALLLKETVRRSLRCERRHSRCSPGLSISEERGGARVLSGGGALTLRITAQSSQFRSLHQRPEHDGPRMSITGGESFFEALTSETQTLKV